MKVYFIATVSDIKKDDFGWLNWGGSHRVVGFYETLDEAKKTVEENLGDLYENGYYPYAIIEEHSPGLYSICSNPIFYKWENGGYKKIRRPKATKGFCNFTI